MKLCQTQRRSLEPAKCSGRDQCGEASASLIGDTYNLWLGEDRIVCAGMPSERSVFYNPDEMGILLSWVFLEHFSPKEQDRIHIVGVSILLERITREEIGLRVV